jgi:hypothetical protein
MQQTTRSWRMDCALLVSECRLVAQTHQVMVHCHKAETIAAQWLVSACGDRWWSIASCEVGCGEAAQVQPSATLTIHNLVLANSMM